MNLEGRVVVVTGGKGRLGQVVIRKFMQSGATVVSIDRPSERPSLVPTVAADVVDEASVQRAFTSIKDEYGSVDVFIHVVGMWAMKPFAETTLADWTLMMDVNLTSAFLCFREAVRHMTGSEFGYGRIIGIASGQRTVAAPAKCRSTRISTRKPRCLRCSLRAISR